MFTKDLEDLNNKQYLMNNTITEMKCSLEETNSRTEADDLISQLKDRMMEITDTEQNKEKKKEAEAMKTASETFGKTLNTSVFKS